MEILFYIAGGPVLMVLVPNGEPAGPPWGNPRYLVYTRRIAHPVVS